MAISKTQPMRPAEIELIETVNNLITGLENEVTHRENAITVINNSIQELETAINNESTNRVNGDSKLQRNIETTKTELQQNIEAAKTEIQTMFKNFTEQLEWGSQDNIEVIANNNTVITVNFTEEKQEAPLVLITLQNNNGETAVNAYAALKDVSTTDFHVRIYNLDESNNQQMKVNWLAIGE